MPDAGSFDLRPYYKCSVNFHGRRTKHRSGCKMNTSGDRSKKQAGCSQAGLSASSSNHKLCFTQCNSVLALTLLIAALRITFVQQPNVRPRPQLLSKHHLNEQCVAKRTCHSRASRRQRQGCVRAKTIASSWACADNARYTTAYVLRKLSQPIAAPCGRQVKYTALVPDRLLRAVTAVTTV